MASRSALSRGCARNYPDTVVGLKDQSGDWANIKAILDAYPTGFEIFLGSEAFLLDGLRMARLARSPPPPTSMPPQLRKVYDNWKVPDADELQAKIGGIRKVFQSQPMIPLMKAIIGHYRNDPAWATLRPPLTELPEKDLAAAIKTLEAEHGFKMDIPDDDDA